MNSQMILWSIRTLQTALVAAGLGGFTYTVASESFTCSNDHSLIPQNATELCQAIGNYVLGCSIMPYGCNERKAENADTLYTLCQKNNQFDCETYGELNNLKHSLFIYALIPVSIFMGSIGMAFLLELPRYRIAHQATPSSSHLSQLSDSYNPLKDTDSEEEVKTQPSTSIEDLESPNLTFIRQDKDNKENRNSYAIQ